MGTDNNSNNLSLDLSIAQVTTANRFLASSSIDQPRFCYYSTILFGFPGFVLHTALLLLLLLLLLLCYGFPGFVGTRLHTPIIVHTALLLLLLLLLFFFFFFFFFFCYGFSCRVFPAAGVLRQSGLYELRVSAARRSSAGVKGNCGTSS